MPIRNEAWILEVSLEAALRWTDKLVLFFHACTDRSFEIAQEVIHRHSAARRVLLLTDRRSDWPEMDHRQIMLEGGRRIGGTHFAVIDADEILTANLVTPIREWIGKLEEGTVLDLPEIQVCDGISRYRADTNGPKDNPERWWTVAFHDSPRVRWEPSSEGYHHHRRVPSGCHILARNRSRPIGHPTKGGVMHFQYADPRRLRAKQALYKVRDELYSIRNRSEVDQHYSETLSRRGMFLKPLPASWTEGYGLHRIRLREEPWQEAEVRRLFQEYGPGRFRHLDLFGVVQNCP